MGLLLAFTLGAERYLKVSTVVYYWAAIVITRTAATNLADLATHSFKFGYGWVKPDWQRCSSSHCCCEEHPRRPGQ